MRANTAACDPRARPKKFTRQHAVKSTYPNLRVSAISLLPLAVSHAKEHDLPVRHTEIFAEHRKHKLLLFLEILLPCLLGDVNGFLRYFSRCRFPGVAEINSALAYNNILVSFVCNIPKGSTAWITLREVSSAGAPREPPAGGK